jgi:NADPH:quinone reductase-like Zn-dependent oxidoreductase
VRSPGHLDVVSAPAVPLAGLTAFRAVFQKGQVAPSSNVLITGIGGGVAIWALQFCVAVGAQVWVTSSSEHKIKQACQLGAKGGVSYAEGVYFTSRLSKDLYDIFSRYLHQSGKLTRIPFPR